MPESLSESGFSESVAAAAAAAMTAAAAAWTRKERCRWAAATGADPSRCVSACADGMHWRQLYIKHGFQEYIKKTDPGIHVRVTSRIVPARTATVHSTPGRSPGDRAGSESLRVRLCGGAACIGVSGRPSESAPASVSVEFRRRFPRAARRRRHPPADPGESRTSHDRPRIGCHARAEITRVEVTRVEVTRVRVVTQHSGEGGQA
jgi:hypothetical protein